MHSVSRFRETASGVILEIPALLRLAWPIILGQIGQMLFGVIDSLMIGRVGTTELAASAFGNSVFTVFLLFGIGFSNSTSPLVSRALGQGDTTGVIRILKNALVVNGSAGIGLTLLALCCLPFFDNMGQAPDVVSAAFGYFLVVSFSLVPVLLFQVHKQFLENTGHARAPMYATAGGLLLNVALNFVFIYGLGPIPALGLLGTAIGTLIARVLMLAVLYPQVSKVRHQLTTSTKNYPTEPAYRDISIVNDLLSLGIPSGFVLLFEVGAFAAAALMMGWIGSAELAAHQVALSMAAMSFMMPMGVAFAAAIRVGFEAGRKDFAKARIAGLSGVVVGASIMTITAIIFALGRFRLPALFSHDPVVLEWSARILVVGALFQIFDGIQVVSVSVLRALKDIRWPLIITLIAYWVIALPGGYYLAFNQAQGPIGIWLGLFAGLAVAAFLLTARFLALVSWLEKDTRTVR